MYVYESRKLVEVWAPAKLNLFLEILGRRSDGFHEIETLMVPINLFDTLYVSPSDDQHIRLECRVISGNTSRDHGDERCLPLEENNLAYRAFELLRQEANCAFGLRGTLIKRIPFSAGMGGGSSDAAAALLAANRLWNLNWPINDLIGLAEKLGSDVPFFLHASSCICRGRGELIEQLSHNIPINLVVATPKTGLSTAEVYRHTKTPDEARSVERLRRCMEQGDMQHFDRLLFNRLQSAACRISQPVVELSNRFNQLDVLGHQMSGSGSSYFAICRNAQHARQTAAKLCARGNERVFATRTIKFPQGKTRLCEPSHN